MTSVPSSVRIEGKEKSELLRTLRERGVQLNPSAEALFSDPRFDPSSETGVVPIRCVTVAELGFAEGATYSELMTRAQQSGLAECPLALGPYLRLQYLDQPEVVSEPATRGEAPRGAITVASAALDESDETPKGFYLRRVDGVAWLRGYRSWPGHLWKPHDMFVVRR